MKFPEGPVAIGALIVFSAWLFIGLPLYYAPSQRIQYYENTQNAPKPSEANPKGTSQNPFFVEIVPTPKSADERTEEARDRQEKRNTDESIATWTKVLGGATVGLIIATLILAYFAFTQWSDTRTLQRAYISVSPKGIRPYMSDDNMLSCDVCFVNAGNLPATNVRWRMDRDFRTESDFRPPPVTKEWSGGTNVVPPKGEMRKGTQSIVGHDFDSFKEHGEPRKCWLYAWGTVEYDDGFNRRRFIDFCHRYNVRGAKSRTILEENGRHHEYGNRTDES